MHPARQQLYGHQPPNTKTIQVRRTRHAGHWWRSRDELIRDILLWTPSHGREKAWQPARTYIQHLYADKGCRLEDPPGAMDDKDGMQEGVKEIHAGGATKWWWIFHLFLSWQIQTLFRFILVWYGILWYPCFMKYQRLLVIKSPKLVSYQQWYLTHN